jgi:hypothetical protein
MADDGLEPFDVTGRWVGFYRHRWEEMGTFPITADVRQVGEALSGEMYDQVPGRSQSLDNILEIVRDDLSPSRRRRVEATIRRFGAGAVVVSSTLPETSDLVGTVRGDQVTFTKTYRGPCQSQVTVGERVLRTLWRDRHRVHYFGRLDREKGCVAGEWIIRRRGLLGRFLPPEGRGTFELYRKT